MRLIEVRASLYVAQNGKCAGCRKRFPIDALQVDHVVPKRSGGPNHITNYALRCVTCNASKGARIEPGSQFNIFGSQGPLLIDQECPTCGLTRGIGGRPRVLTDAQHREKRRLKTAAYRAKQRAAGFCIVCLTNPANTGCATCWHCGDKANKRKRR